MSETKQKDQNSSETDKSEEKPVQDKDDQTQRRQSDRTFQQQGTEVRK